jgi:hypothetical protein
MHNVFLVEGVVKSRRLHVSKKYSLSSVYLFAKAIISFSVFCALKMYNMFLVQRAAIKSRRLRVSKIYKS